MMENNPTIDEFYSEYYQTLLGKGATGLVFRQTHVSLERGIPSGRFYSKVLELGAGNGQHYSFVRHDFGEYFETDLREQNIPNREDLRVTKMAQNAQKLSDFSNESIDRVIATCLLIHLEKPELALHEWKRVLKKLPGNRIDIYVPCEPSLTLRFARFFSTRRRAKKMGFSHAEIHYREHPFNYMYLRILVNSVFADARKIRWKNYPTRLLTWDFSLWTIVTIEY